MTGLEIGLIVIGLVFFVGSFFFTEKLSSSDLEAIEKMGEKEMNILLEKQMNKASDRIGRTIDDKMASSLAGAERQINKTANDHIMSISEHATQVRKMIDNDMQVANKSHDEISFMYSMLNDKQKKITELAAEAQRIESQIRALKQSIEDELLPQLEKSGSSMSVDVTAALAALEAADLPSEEAEVEEESTLKEVMEQRIEEANEEEQTPVEVLENVNEKIIDLHREGYSDVDIAKRLGKGLGEIKLVLGLYDEEA